MKKLLGIVVLGLLLTLSAKADDIRDFEIEGMSIGDSLLDYVREDKIKENSKPLSIGNKKYYQYRKYINSAYKYQY